MSNQIKKKKIVNLDKNYRIFFWMGGRCAPPY